MQLAQVETIECRKLSFTRNRVGLILYGNDDVCGATNVCISGLEQSNINKTPLLFFI